MFFFYQKSLAKEETSEKLNILIPKIEGIIKQYPKLFCGVYIKTNYLKGDVNIYGEYPLAAASLIKLPVAVVVLHEIQKGKLNWDDELTIRKRHKAYGSGVLRHLRIGSKIKLKKVFELMLTISDNTAFNMIVDHIGGIAACNRKMCELGLEKTILKEYIVRFNGHNRVSPQDLIFSLEKSIDNSVLNKDLRTYFNEVLLGCKNGSLIKAGLGKHCKFAHKTGTIGIALGDAGIIYRGGNKKIYIAIIVERDFGAPDATKLIREVARTVNSVL